MRIVITGAAGLLGSALTKAFAAEDEVHAFTRAALDITDWASVEACLGPLRPEVILNCAAYNEVDAAESDAVAALAVNASGVLTLAQAARAADATLVHYSTDFVFNGETTRPYVEEDEPGPKSVYAASKLLGEWLAADAPRYYVLRVESLFGPARPERTRRGSLGMIVERIKAGEVVPVFVDRTVSPSFTVDIAAATRRLMALQAPPGTYHCVNSGTGTWRDVAQEAARILGLELRVRELTLETAGGKAARPKYSALSPARLATLGIVMPDWRDALARYLSL